MTLRLANGKSITVSLERREEAIVKGDRIYDYNLSGPLGKNEGKIPVTKDPQWTRNDEPGFKLDGLSSDDSAFMVSALESILVRKFEIGKPNGRFRLKEAVSGWNDRPKTVSNRSIELKEISIIAKYVVDGNRIEKKMGTMLVPTGNFSAPEYTEAKVPNPETGSRDLDKLAPGVSAIEVKPWRPEFQDTDAIVARYNLQITSKSMQRFSVSGVNPDTETVVITIKPGMMLAPNRASVQHVGIASEFKLVLPPASLVATLFGSGNQARSTAVGDSLCLEFLMEWPENDSMRIALPNSAPITRMLENATADGKINRKDQTAVWIVNDAPTFEDVRKTLNPDPSPTEYVEALFEAGTVAKVDLRSSVYDKCLDPNLLLSVGSVPATSYVARIIAELKPKVYRDFLSNQKTTIQDWLARGTEAEKLHALALLGAAAGTQDRDSRNWVGDFLIGSRTAIGNSGTLKLLWSSSTLRTFQESLLGNDPLIADKAIEVLLAFPTESSVQWLRSASADLPAKTRQKAEATAESIGNSGTMR